MSGLFPFQMVGSFFIKASAHELMRYNQINGGDSYFYSFEHEGANSLFNLLFIGQEPPPVPHGMLIKPLVWGQLLKIQRERYDLITDLRWLKDPKSLSHLPFSLGIHIR